jgi:carbon monoxide dehydrogenase subunit G
MEFDNAFEVPLPADEAWKVLMDIRRIAPCLPGAELTEVVDDRTYKGKVGVRLGPVSLAFAGTVKFEEIDDVNHRAKVAAQGSDAKGRGAANATATSISGGRSGSGAGAPTDAVRRSRPIRPRRHHPDRGADHAQFANNLKAQLGPVVAAPLRPPYRTRRICPAVVHSPETRPAPRCPPSRFPPSPWLAVLLPGSSACSGANKALPMGRRSAASTGQPTGLPAPIGCQER